MQAVARGRARGEGRHPWAFPKTAVSVRSRPKRWRLKPMAMDAGEIERLIKAGIPDAEVTIRDLAGDGNHYAATVIAPSFKGKSRVQQHQLVYESLKGQMGGVLHALALQTGAPGALSGRFRRI